MNRFKLDFKKLRDGAITPTYGSEYAAGADLYACIDYNKSGSDTVYTDRFGYVYSRGACWPYICQKRHGL